MIIMTFISMHSVIICVVFSGACMRCTRLCSLKPGVTEVVSEEMLTVGRNLDRTRHTIFICKNLNKTLIPKTKGETKILDQTYYIPFLTNLGDEILFKGVGFVIPDM